jgi:molybdate transport system regulatory protein
MSDSSNLRGRLSLEKDGNPFLGVGRIDLLEAVEKHGSITHAARAVGMSYKGAWDAIDAMNNQADEPLVIRTPGGRHGGGTRLTDYGKRVLGLVRSIEQEYQRALALLDERNQEFGEYKRLLRRFSLQTSARNLWVGTVATMQADRVHASVGIALDDHLTITANISTESARRLRLAVGVEVFSMVKAVSVRVSAISDDQPRPTSNEFRGTVLRCTREATQAELSIELPGGRTIAAVVPADDAVAEIEEGNTVMVHFDPNGVVLVLL